MDSSDNMPEDQTEISLEFLQHELSASFMRVWETLVCMPLEQTNSTISEEYVFPWLGAVAWIGGSWTGNIRIGVPKELASIITSCLLEIERPSSEQTEDALRELANMVAGNLKSALPGKCGLATPGNFAIMSLDTVQDEFSSIMINWYLVERFPLFLAISALHPHGSQDAFKEL